MRKITSAALRFRRLDTDEQLIIKGHRHSDIFDALYQLHIPCDKTSFDQGFIAYDKEIGEEFVDRLTAYKIARDAGQIYGLNEIAPLYTEDLW